MKLIYFVLLLGLMIPSAFAMDLSNSNSTGTVTYYNASVDTLYNLDVTDSITYFNSKVSLNKDNYPYIIDYIFKDKDNNSIDVIYSINYIQNTFINTISMRATVLYNGVLTHTEYRKTQEFFIDSNISDFNFLSDSNTINTGFGLSLTGILFPESYRYSWAKGQNNFIIPHAFYARHLVISEYTGVQYNDINIEYQDNGIAVIKNDINSGLNSLNPVFKLIFIVAKAVLGVLNVTGAVSDTTFYDFQLSILTPLEFLNVFLNTLFFMLRWIFTMGLLWTFAIATLIIFLISYGDSQDIFDCMFNVFPRKEVNFISIVIVKPVIWVYEKIVLLWAR